LLHGAYACSFHRDLKSDWQIISSTCSAETILL